MSAATRSMPGATTSSETGILILAHDARKQYADVLRASAEEYASGSTPMLSWREHAYRLGAGLIADILRTGSELLKSVRC